MGYRLLRALSKKSVSLLIFFDFEQRFEIGLRRVKHSSIQHLPSPTYLSRPAHLGCGSVAVVGRGPVLDRTVHSGTVGRESTVGSRVRSVLIEFEDSSCGSTCNIVRVTHKR